MSVGSHTYFPALSTGRAWEKALLGGLGPRADTPLSSMKFTGAQAHGSRKAEKTWAQLQGLHWPHWGQLELQDKA